MGIISGLLGFIGCWGSKTDRKGIIGGNSGYKLYVQYIDKKELKEGSVVKLNGEVVGKVIGLDENPDAYILTLLIKEGLEIPLLSKFKIKAENDHNFFIVIEYSNDKRLIRANDYFSGE